MSDTRILCISQDANRLWELYSSARLTLTGAADTCLLSKQEARLLLNSRTLDSLTFDTVLNALFEPIKKEAEAKAMAVFHRIQLVGEVEWVKYWHGGEEQTFIVPSSVFESEDFLRNMETRSDTLVQNAEKELVPFVLFLVREEYVERFKKLPEVGSAFSFLGDSLKEFQRKIYAPILPLFLIKNNNQPGVEGPSKIYELMNLRHFVIACTKEFRDSNTKSPTLWADVARLTRKLVRVYLDIASIDKYPTQAYRTLRNFWSVEQSRLLETENWVVRDEELFSAIRDSTLEAMSDFGQTTHREFALNSRSENPDSDFFLGWVSHLGFENLTFSQTLDKTSDEPMWFEDFLYIHGEFSQSRCKSLNTLKELLPLNNGSKNANLRVIERGPYWDYFTSETDDLGQLVEQLSAHGVPYMASPAPFLPYSEVQEIMDNLFIEVEMTEQSMSDKVKRLTA